MRGRLGQITILILLLSLLGLTTALSLSSQSLSDLKQVSYVDAGTKALAGAEAGLQYALTTPLPSSGCSQGTISQSILSLSGISNITYKLCGSTKDSVFVPNVPKDDVFQLDLAGVNSNLKSFDVSWKSDASVEIIVLDSDSTIRRYAYNANTSLGLARNNGFAAGQSGVNCSPGCDASFNGGSCTGYGEILYKPGTHGTRAQLVRVRPLYQSSDINFCGRSSGNSSSKFGLQYYQVEASATTANGTLRRIQIDRYPPALPAIFDNVLYNGGDITK